MKENRKQKPPRTIKEIVADLRAKGELDEEKYTALIKRKTKILYWAFTLFLFISLTQWEQHGWTGLSIALVLGILIIGGIIRSKGLDSRVEIYTLGKKTKGKVLYAKSDPRFDRGVPNHYIYRYEYFDADTTRHEYLFEPLDYKIASVSRPNVGDKLDILYMEDRPKITTPFIEYLDEQFNLRKK